MIETEREQPCSQVILKLRALSGSGTDILREFVEAGLDYGPPTPVATETFSPNGSWGDLISAGSLTFGAYKVAAAGGSACTAVTEGTDERPFSAGFTILDSDVAVDRSGVEYDGRGFFVAGKSGDTLFELPLPLTDLGRFF